MKEKQEISESVRELILKAWRAGKNAYAPYSGFRVGAALLAKSGRIYTGCNVESASFSPTCCAERTALCKAISEGERGFAAIAVVGVREGEKDFGFCPPCGVCRQFLREFCAEDFAVFLASGKEDGAEADFAETEKFTLGELLPHSFGGENFCGEKGGKGL